MKKTNRNDRVYNGVEYPNALTAQTNRMIDEGMDATDIIGRDIAYFEARWERIFESSGGNLPATKMEEFETELEVLCHKVNSRFNELPKGDRKWAKGRLQWMVYMPIRHI